MATLPVRLSICEENRPPSQSSLLKDPATLIKTSLKHVLVEIVNELPDVDWRAPVLVLNDQHICFLTRLEKSIRLSQGRASSQYTGCIAEDVAHALRLVLKISIVALDDAEGVNPEVLESQRSSDLDCMTEGRGQFIHLYTGKMLVDVFPVSAEMRWRSPWVRQSQVLERFSCLGFMQLDKVVLVLWHEDQPRG